MSYLSDAITVALVLILLFGSIALYLYTRMQQSEKKINLLESILLDLKMSAEVKSYTDLPAEDVSEPLTAADYTPFHDEEDHEENEHKEEEGDSVSDEKIVLDMDSLSKASSRAPTPPSAPRVLPVEEIVVVKEQEPAYDSMNLKELHALGRMRGIKGASTMNKHSILEALKASDAAAAKPGSSASSALSGSSSFLENSEWVSESQ